MAVFLVLVSGALVADVGSIARCLGWPLDGLVAEAGEVSGALPPARRVLGGVTAVLILAEATVGLLMLTQGFNGLLGGMYVVAAAGIWALLVVTTVLAALPSGSSKR